MGSRDVGRTRNITPSGSAHKTRLDCRQKHITLLNIRRRHLYKNKIPVSTVFTANLDYASTMSEDKMGHTRHGQVRSHLTCSTIPTRPTQLLAHRSLVKVVDPLDYTYINFKYEVELQSTLELTHLYSGNFLQAAFKTSVGDFGRSA